MISATPVIRPHRGEAGGVNYCVSVPLHKQGVFCWSLVLLVRGVDLTKCTETLLVDDRLPQSYFSFTSRSISTVDKPVAVRVSGERGRVQKSTLRGGGGGGGGWGVKATTTF